jgi:hypothetical protein
LQGLLTTVLQQGSNAAGLGPHALLASVATASAPAAAAAGNAQVAGPDAAATPTPQQAVPGATGTDATGTPKQLPDHIKGSWLVQTLLGQQPQQPSGGKTSAVAATPDFIRIAGAGKQHPATGASGQQQTAASLVPQQQVAAGSTPSVAEAANAGTDAAAGGDGDRRKQLKQVLRKLLAEGAAGPLPDGLAGLMEGLKGLVAGSQASMAAAAAAAAAVQRGQQASSSSSTAAASLVALLQQQQEQQQEQQQGQQEQRTQLSKAQQLVLQRRKAQEAELQRHLQQQEQAAEGDRGGRPGWQSDVYVPPPARMLRVKKDAAADVWNAPAGDDGPGECWAWRLGWD